MVDSLEAAWDDVHEAVPVRWTVGRTTFDPAGDGSWSVSAVGTTKRGEIPQSVTGTGVSEVEALRDLNQRLRGFVTDRGTRLDELRARLRLAYVEGAEDWSRENYRRQLSLEEFERVAARFPARRG